MVCRWAMPWSWRNGRRTSPGKLVKQVVWPLAAKSANLVYPIH